LLLNIQIFAEALILRGFSLTTIQKNFADKFFDRMWVVPPTLLAIVSYEYITNEIHSKTWSATTAIVETFRPVCRFSKHFWYQKNSSFAEEFCDNSVAIQQRLRDGWQQEPEFLRKVLIGVNFMNSTGVQEHRYFKPWIRDVPTPLSVGTVYNVQYSNKDSSQIDFAGRPDREANDALKGIILMMVVCFITVVWWRIKKLKTK
jgi:hypothetical protein